VKLLCDHLSSTPLLALGRGAPRFDAGWHPGGDTGSLCLAEVKSLTVPIERQQVRLGLGQVLGYAAQVQAQHPDVRVTPVLVLEKQPKEAHWKTAARSM